MIKSHARFRSSPAASRRLAPPVFSSPIARPSGRHRAVCAPAGVRPPRHEAGALASYHLGRAMNRERIQDMVVAFVLAAACALCAAAIAGAVFGAEIILH